MLFVLDASIFTGVHPSLAERKGREVARDAREYGIIVGEVGYTEDGSTAFDADVSTSTPQRIYSFCEAFGVARVDFSRAADFAIYLNGRSNPVALQVAQAFAQGAIDQELLTMMTPDELFGRAREIGEACIEASNVQMDNARGIGPFAVAELERAAIATMRQNGIKVPDIDDSFLDPPAPRKPAPLTGEWEGWDAEQFVGNTAPEGWTGF